MLTKKEIANTELEDVYVWQKYGMKHNTVRIRLKGFDKDKTPILEIFTTKPKEAQKIIDALYTAKKKIRVKELKIPTFEDVDKKIDKKLDDFENLVQLGWDWFKSKIDGRFGEEDWEELDEDDEGFGSFRR